MKLIKHALLLTGAASLSCAALADDLTVATVPDSIKIYGDLADGYVNSSNEKGKSNNYFHSGAFRANRLGFTGQEDLGNGTSAVFTLEAGFDLNTGNQASAGVLFNRQSFVGLVNRDYGSILVGRQYSPYYQNVGPSAVTGPLSGATGTHPGDYDGLDTDMRVTKAITYVTPTVDGVSASAMVAFGGDAGHTSSGGTVSAGISYKGGPWSAGIGYIKLKNGAHPNGAWDSNATGVFVKSVVNIGYLSAESIQHIAAAARYTFNERWSLGANATNSQFVPGQLSLFKDTEVFNSWGGAVTYHLNKHITFSAGFAYTKAAAANGIDDPARYREVSLEQTYEFSKYAYLYALEANTRSSGKTLGAAGSGIVDAVALEGENTTASSGFGQRVTMVGLAVLF